MSSSNGSTQGEQSFTPGMHVQPTAITAMAAHRLLPDGQRAVILHVEHGTGSTVLVLSTDLAMAISRMLVEKAGGIEIVRNL